MSKLVQFDSVCNVYGVDDRHHPALGSKIEELHPRGGGFLATAVLCKVKSAVTADYVGVVNVLTWEVEQVTKARFDAAAGGFVGSIGGDGAVGEKVWVVVNGIWTLRVKAQCNAGRVLYTSGTTGALDDAQGSQSMILGATCLENKGAGDGLALCRMVWAGLGMKTS